MFPGSRKFRLRQVRVAGLFSSLRCDPLEGVFVLDNEQPKYDIEANQSQSKIEGRIIAGLFVEYTTYTAQVR